MTTMIIREQLADLVREGLRAAQAAGDFPAFELPEVAVAPSRHTAHGDYGSPVCLSLARELRRAPLQIAQTLAAHIPSAELVAEVSVAPPGYVNFALDPGWLARQTPVILEAGETWGNVDLGQGARVQVEYVSANPTGPITVGSARNAVIGDTIAAVLSAAGYAVEREYYINDAGAKVRSFGESIFSRYAARFGEDYPFPEQGYPGAYITDLAALLAEDAGREFFDLDRRLALREVAYWGMERVMDQVREDLSLLRVQFDTWRHEREFYVAEGLFEQMIEKLGNGDHLIEYDGATWFRHPDLEKDAVLVRSAEVVADPEDRPTYLASDVCYLWDKLVLREFARAIYVWGADHHGDVPRVQAAAKAVGLDPDRLVFVLYQMVNLTRSGEAVRMSKSSGDFVTLRELIDEVGPDPIRFMMLTRTIDVTLEFDLDLAVEQSERNPVYYVQYAHTRIAGVLRKAEEEGFDPQADGDPALLTHPTELDLLRKMLALPETIEVAARNLAPHHLTTYAIELASLFHAFYRDCRIVDPTAPELTHARLLLARAAKSVLARVLHLIGVDAPERM